jgi:hypothetical protein
MRYSAGQKVWIVVRYNEAHPGLLPGKHKGVVIRAVTMESIARLMNDGGYDPERGQWYEVTCESFGKSLIAVERVLEPRDEDEDRRTIPWDECVWKPKEIRA